MQANAMSVSTRANAVTQKKQFFARQNVCKHQFARYFAAHRDFLVRFLKQIQFLTSITDC
jgi:hypothetical protein